MTLRKNRLKAKIAENRCVIGPNLQIPSPWLVEIIGLTGFDYVMLDGEHGAAFSNLPTLILAADAAGITPIVRVPSHDRGFITQALEAGAGGIMVPMVNTTEQARYLVDETKYAPLGRRGFSNATRAARFGAITEGNLHETVNPEIMLIVQLETKEALGNAVEIARIPGIDMIFIGPADLAQSMGLPGQSKAPEVIAAMVELIGQIGQFVAIGTSSFSDAQVRFWKDEGVQAFLTSSMHPIRRAFEGVYRELASGLGEQVG